MKQKTLDMHLVTCESYTCNYWECKLTFKTISKLKSHISETHKTQHQKKNTEILHNKVNRKNSEIIETGSYKAIYFFEWDTWKEIQ